MRNWAVNSTFGNKKPFSSLIPLSPTLWLHSSTGEGLREHQAARQILCSQCTDLPSLVAGSNLWAILTLQDENYFGDLFPGGYSNLTPSPCSRQVCDILMRDCPNHSLSSIHCSVPLDQCVAVLPLEHPGPVGFGWLFSTIWELGKVPKATSEWRQIRSKCWEEAKMHSHFSWDIGEQDKLIPSYELQDSVHSQLKKGSN